MLQDLYFCIFLLEVPMKRDIKRRELLCIILYDLINTVICCSFQCSNITESQVHLNHFQEQIQTSNDLSTAANELSFASAPKQPNSVCKADQTIYTFLSSQNVYP